MLGLFSPPAPAFLCTEPPASKPGHTAQEPGAEEDLGDLDYGTGLPAERVPHFWDTGYN